MNIRLCREKSKGVAHAMAAVPLLFLLSLCVAVALAGCGTSNQAQGNVQLRQESYPYFWGSEAKDQQFKLYFVEGADIPYVAVSEFMPLYGELYQEKTFGVSAEFDIAQEGGTTTVKRRDNGATMALNAGADSIHFSDLDLFTQPPNSASLHGLMATDENGLGGSARLLEVAGETYDRAGTALDLDLAAYSIDILNSGGECYIPLQTASDVLVGRFPARMVFNGKAVYLMSLDLGDTDELYSVPTGQMSKDFAAFNYNELRLLLDTFYGLKTQHNIENFEAFFESTGLKEGLTSTDPEQFDAALRELIDVYIDDLHSGFQAPSTLAGLSAMEAEAESLAGLTLEEMLTGNVLQLGTSAVEYELNSIAYKAYREKYYPDIDVENRDCFLYEEVDDTAIITFDSFTSLKSDYRSGANITKPSDTIELIVFAHERITRENSPIKNVVIDLSNNGGGEAEVAAFIAGWCKGPTPLAVRDVLTGAQSVVSYRADVNLDGKFDKNDVLPTDRRVYCLTGPGSFSCGNLIPAAFKGSPRITLLGRTSGGGTCTVLPCSTASGALFSVSSTEQISTVKNGSFYDIDRGIEPDFGIDKMETFYDRAQLVEFIHNLK